jgi:hypothetical protein
MRETMQWRKNLFWLLVQSVQSIVDLLTCCGPVVGQNIMEHERMTGKNCLGHAWLGSRMTTVVVFPLLLLSFHQDPWCIGCFKVEAAYFKDRSFPRLLLISYASLNLIMINYYTFLYNQHNPKIKS